MKSPRKLRPHQVVIRHKVGEDDDFNAIYEDTYLKRVKFDDSVTLNQSTEGKESQKMAMIIIDCSDLHARKNYIRCRYVSSSHYKPSEGFFSIFVNDLVIYNEREYTVTKVDEVNPLGKKSQFIEVICNG